MRSFPERSVGLVREQGSDFLHVWLIGKDEVWRVPVDGCLEFDITKTGDKHEQKVCDRCHRLLTVDNFAQNQNNVHGILRRPSCKRCRTDIDKRAPKSEQARRKERERPKKGEPFQCPICRRWRIAGVTVKVVADHDHHTGNIRDFVCDSCNTGLGRFRNGVNHLEDAIAYIRDHDTLN